VHDLDAKRLLFATEGREHQTVVDFAADLKAHGGDPADVWTYPNSTDTVGLRFDYSGWTVLRSMCSGAGLSNGPACGQAGGRLLRA
jgi:hypothetical protein